MGDTELGSQIVGRAIELLSEGRSFDDIMRDTLGMAGAACPSPIWSTMAKVDRRADVSALGSWVPDTLLEHPAPSRLTGLWFGLYEVAPEEEQYPTGAEAVLELSGGSGFPNDPDWLFKQNWYPGGYAPTPGLRSLLRIAASSEDHFELVSYAFVLTYSLGMVAAALDATDPAQLLRGADELAIAVGFTTATSRSLVFCPPLAWAGPAWDGRRPSTPRSCSPNAGSRGRSASARE